MDPIKERTFTAIFVDNIMARSGTAKGEPNTTTSSDLTSGKLPLLLSGQELVVAVRTQAEIAARTAWVYREIEPNAGDISSISGELYQALMEGIVDFAEYQKMAPKGADTNLGRYRLWTPDYLEGPLASEDVPDRMDEFHQNLARQIEIPDGEEKRRFEIAALTLADMLGQIDYVLEDVIHPWVDGCGRYATAMVMWIALVAGDGRLPVYDDHFTDLHGQGLDERVTYYKQCFQRNH